VIDVNQIYRGCGVLLAITTINLGTGCQTPDGRPNNAGTGALVGGTFGALTGALIGGASHHAGLGAAIGGLTGVVAGGLIGHSMDEQQRSWMRQHSPQTLQKVEHNDAVAQQQAATPPTNAAPLVTTSTTSPPEAMPAPATPPPSAAPSATGAPQMQALTVEDIKALSGAGVKDDVVIAEIKRSNSRFGQQDVAALQEAGVSPAVVDYIKANGS
jgi:outer membrane lipoprotein SlyB